ncbi:hypothetical protein [Streptomyces sp. NPDC101393]|uniref:hypothetical protein n=1 Tax=Streptomyces sp. NPDC101393 TaxID=3366141 RepID=UPI0037F113D7
MITAWLPSGVRRLRSPAAPLRALVLGLFLVGLLYSHAVSPDATLRHFSSGGGVSTTGVHPEPAGHPATTAAAAHSRFLSEVPDGGHHGDHGQQHTHDECALGQPPQGPGGGAPGGCSPTSERYDLTPVWTRPAPSPAADFVVPIPHAAQPTVLRM